MSEQRLARQAARVGLQVNWQDAQGCKRRVSADTLHRLIPLLEAIPGPSGTPSMLVTEVGLATPIPLHGKSHAKETATSPPFVLTLEDGRRIEGRLRVNRDGCLVLPHVTETGYHTLAFGAQEIPVAVAPAKAPPIPHRSWGVAAQIYGLRTRGDGGIGHLGAVGDLARRIGKAGGDALMLSPMHAMFTARADHYSPYSPSNRMFLNILLADPGCLFDSATILAACKQARIKATDLHRLETAALTDWPHAAPLRLKLFRALYDHHIAGSPPKSFTTFVNTGGTPLLCHAIFEALHAQALLRGPRGGDWRLWPLPLRRPDTPEVSRFARDMGVEIDFHRFLQWLARCSLQSAHNEAHKGGMRVGLIGDLAVGVDPTGSECWCHQDNHLTEISIGAPPDALSPTGQNWGLTTFSPRALVASGYHSFIAMLRANFAHVDGLRIDHVMEFERLWIIPRGGSSDDGAYLSYPRTDLLRLAALEASRAHAILIGEDLGTVDPSFREDMAHHGLAGMNVLPFQRDAAGAFIPASQWSKTAVGLTTTHDLPPLARWWQGMDLQPTRNTTSTEPETPQAVRAHDRCALWGVMTKGMAKEPAPSTAGTAAFVDRAVEFVAETPCPLVVLPLEDLAVLTQQPNVPGTTTTHPNWQHRYPAPARALLARRGVSRRLTILSTARPRPDLP
ncbi:4-alpha-glucanotransferase [Acetobacter conturbans]|uniref:4-alpha-glucanotransferase n=1 Tax=Acetobacter conturbans TaxID=1737472 RepID=A0ABX0K171_9PROT|nr:4-alpha-glucanotransferase [Acetobacter conturbans]NHN89010.1 4-alpha-glucanotransferase [Acetobacter conturbans]